MRFIHLLSILLLMLFVSCEFESGDIKYNMGNDFVNDPTNVLMIDTLTVRTFTTTVDSFATSRLNRLLTGKFTNQYGIETYSEAYFRFDAAAFGGFNASSKFDSIVLVLNFDGYKFGDTTKVAEFEVFRLTEEIVYNENNQYIYNHQKFDADETPIGSFKLDYNNPVDSIFVKISDDLGQKFFDFAFEGADSISDNELFKEMFKGVVIKPAANNDAFIIGINANADSITAPRLRVYYNDINPVDELFFEIPLEQFELFAGTYSPENSNYCAFSHIVNNYEGSVLEGISSETPLQGTLTDNVTFLQGSGMLSTHIQIPFIDHLYQFGIGSIIKAELIIEPLESTFSQKSNLPGTLLINLVDNKFRYYNPLYITGTTDLAYATLNYDHEFKENTHYVYDITNYIKSEYEEFADPMYSMLLVMPGTSSMISVDQLIIGNRINRDNRLKMKIYLTNFNDQIQQ